MSVLNQVQPPLIIAAKLMLWVLLLTWHDQNYASLKASNCLHRVVVTEEEHDSCEEEVKGDVVRSKGSDAVLEAVLLLLSQLRGDQLNTVKDKVQHLLSQE